MVDDVPALSCMHCGEKYYDVKTLQQIEGLFEAIYQQGQMPTRQVAVAIPF